MTAGITATQLVFSPSYFVGIQAAKAYASAMEAAESSSIADARRAAGEAYAAALAAEENVAILREAEALATDAFKQTRALVEPASPKPPMPTSSNSPSPMSPSSAPRPKAWRRSPSTR